MNPAATVGGQERRRGFQAAGDGAQDKSCGYGWEVKSVGAAFKPRAMERNINVAATVGGQERRRGFKPRAMERRINPAATVGGQERRRGFQAAGDGAQDESCGYGWEVKSVGAAFKPRAMERRINLAATDQVSLRLCRIIFFVSFVTFVVK